MSRNTEYAVEVYDKRGFNRQIDVRASVNEAKALVEGYNKPLTADEYLRITYIEYDEKGNEVGMGLIEEYFK